MSLADPEGPGPLIYPVCKVYVPSGCALKVRFEDILTGILQGSMLKHQSHWMQNLLL